MAGYCHCGTNWIRQLPKKHLSLTVNRSLFVSTKNCAPEIIGHDDNSSTDVIEDAKAKLKAMRSRKRKPTGKSTSQKLSSRSKERAVPSSKFSRLANYGSLVAGLGIGAISETVKKQLGRDNGVLENAGGIDSVFLSEANAERIVDTLCKVRGAALKLGQMISFSDNDMMPKQLQHIFDRVRSNADYMPQWQLEEVLNKELGEDWRDKVEEFDPRPFAAASIGQVHQVTTKEGTICAMKIQYPGVAESIDSDIDTLLSIMIFSKLLPEGLFFFFLITYRWYTVT